MAEPSGGFRPVSHSGITKDAADVDAEPAPQRWSPLLQTRAGQHQQLQAF
jgi:hypothetical protein